jgi:O-acetyl-ADP-ribose deacetylase (regulator of RNase III)
MVNLIQGNLFNSTAKVICHQCNCQGVMGSGVAAEVKKRYPHVYNEYRNDYEKGLLKLGYVNFANATSDQVIANMCGQEKYGYDGKQYTSYDNLRQCLNTVKEYMINNNIDTVAFPYMMSCCRGGGNWNVVYQMIENVFTDCNVEIWKL